MMYAAFTEYDVFVFFRDESLHAEDTSREMLNLSAWEQWLVSKAKEERIKMHQKSLQVDFIY